MNNDLINKVLIMKAYFFLKAHEFSIPHETLDFMKDSALEKLEGNKCNCSKCTGLEVESLYENY